jgi:hypothetical protein
MLGDARDFLQGKAPKEIHAILTETLREHAPSYATVKNWVAQFKRDFSTCDAPRPGRKTRYTPRLILQLVVHVVDLGCYNALITPRENGSLRVEALWSYV